MIYACMPLGEPAAALQAAPDSKQELQLILYGFFKGLLRFSKVGFYGKMSD